MITVSKPERILPSYLAGDKGEKNLPIKGPEMRGLANRLYTNFTRAHEATPSIEVVRGDSKKQANVIATYEPGIEPNFKLMRDTLITNNYRIESEEDQ